MRRIILTLIAGLLLAPCILTAQSNSKKYQLLKELIAAESFARAKITSGNASPEYVFAQKALEHVYHARDILDVLQFKDSITTDNYLQGKRIIEALKTLIETERRTKSGQLSLLYYMTDKKLEEYFTNLTKH